MEKRMSIGDENINPIFEKIKGLINNSRDRVYSAVNTEMLNLYWNIGKIKMEMKEQVMVIQFQKNYRKN